MVRFGPVIVNAGVRQRKGSAGQLCFRLGGASRLLIKLECPAILAATDLIVRYNERTILDAATLGIEEGDRIGLVGRNGCGKTTFLKILAGLQSPDGGEVTTRRDLVVSYLSQDFTLDASLDVRGNVRQGAWRTWI